MYAQVAEHLPYATSVGLSTAFRSQKSRFRWPQRGWLFAFAASITLLVLLAAPDLVVRLQQLKGLFGSDATTMAAVSGAKEVGDWGALLQDFAHRLPLIIPLVWLAIFAGRNYSMSLRMEEDYAYKEAISVAFEGYKREMTDIDKVDEKVISPLHTLCGNVLMALAQRPGRIYEGQHQDVTPLTPLSNAIAEAALKNRNGGV